MSHTRSDETSPEQLKRYVEKAKELGALDAKVIDAGTIEVANWVRMKCLFGCTGPGGLTCPPHTPSPEEMKRVVGCYDLALLIRVPRKKNVTMIAHALETEMFFDGYYKAFGIGAGSCNMCKECDNETCKHPERARPSMESCCIDVYKTVRSNGFPIEVLRTREETPNYYGIVLIE